MADLVDAGNGVAAAIVAALTLGSGGTCPLIGGAVVKAYVGWPNSQTLDVDLALGAVHISIWPTPMEKVTAVYEQDADWFDDTTTQGSIETRRQQRRFQVSIWANTPANRDTLGRALDAALSTTYRLILADGSAAIMSYAGSQIVDSRQTTNLYRRDAFYEVNYATIQTAALTEIQHTQTNVTGGGFAQAGPTVTVIT